MENNFYKDQWNEYSGRLSGLDAEINELSKRLRMIVGGRLLAFILIIVFVAGLFGKSTAFYFLALVFFILFLILIRFDRKIRENLNFKRALKSINSQELIALENDISGFGDGTEYINPSHPFSYDLDIFGKGSLYQYLNRTCTIQGKDRLAEVLRTLEQEHETIRKRQAAGRELELMIDTRQEFRARGMLAKASAEDTEELLEWVSEKPEFSSRVISILVSLVPVTSILFIALSFLPSISINLLILYFLLIMSIAGIYLKKVNYQHSRLSRKFSILNQYSQLLELLESTSFDSDYLNAQTSILKSGNQTAGQKVKRLSSLMNALDNRLNMIAGLVLNALMLWDLQCMTRLEKWKAENREHLLNWLKVIGEFDAIMSLANFGYNHSTYMFPTILVEDYIFDSEGLGHPLIEPATRVYNNFKLEKRGSFVVLTGANMAGKSTFLRTVGINMILAMSGSRVAARSMRISPLQLHTSMRTSDSLYKNESYFFAELKRLSEIIESLKSGKPAFIILDELLKGTNSRDKQTGSMEMLRQLIKLPAWGILATHDLELGKLATEFPDHIENFCFEVSSDEHEMYFDYKLRSGVCQNLNATYLMKKMGIMN